MIDQEFRHKRRAGLALLLAAVAAPSLALAGAPVEAMNLSGITPPATVNDNEIRPHVDRLGDDAYAVPAPPTLTMHTVQITRPTGVVAPSPSPFFPPHRKDSEMTQSGRLSLLTLLLFGLPGVGMAGTANGVRENLSAQQLTAPGSYLFIPQPSGKPLGDDDRPKDQAFLQYTYVSRYFWRIRGEQEKHRIQFVCDLKQQCDDIEDMAKRTQYVDKVFEKLHSAVNGLPAHALVRIRCPITIQPYSEKAGGFPIQTCINQKTQVGQTTAFGEAVFENPYDRQAGIHLYPAIATTADQDGLIQTMSDQSRRKDLNQLIAKKGGQDGVKATAMIYGHLQDALPTSETEDTYRELSMAVDGYTIRFSGQQTPSATFALVKNPIQSGSTSTPLDSAAKQGDAGSNGTAQSSSTDLGTPYREIHGNKPSAASDSASDEPGKNSPASSHSD